MPLASHSEIAVIDVSPLQEGGPKGLAQVANQIGPACRGIGFFYVTGHSVPPALLASVFQASRHFFTADPTTKAGVSITRSPHNRGYVGMAVEALDPSKPADLKEAFNIGLELADDDPEVLSGKPFRGLNLWPDMPDFRSTLLAYFDAVWGLGVLLHRAFAADLGLRPDYFDDKLDRPMATLRLLHYPQRPSETADGQLGAGEHTDYGNVTLLATDDAGGLEVRTRSGTWISAPVIPGAFICNIGDCLMRWTNNVYVSTPHRVVNPSGRERFSVAFFLDPNPEAVVACLPSCCSVERPPVYPAIKAAEYLRLRLDATYSHRRSK